MTVRVWIAPPFIIVNANMTTTSIAGKTIQELVKEHITSRILDPWRQICELLLQKPPLLDKCSYHGVAQRPMWTTGLSSCILYSQVCWLNFSHKSSLGIPVGNFYNFYFQCRVCHTAQCNNWYQATEYPASIYVYGTNCFIMYEGVIPLC